MWPHRWDRRWGKYSVFYADRQIWIIWAATINTKNCVRRRSGKWDGICDFGGQEETTTPRLACGTGTALPMRRVSHRMIHSCRREAATHSQTVAWALSIFFYSCRADNLPSIGNLVSYAWCSRAADGLALRHLSYIAASSRFYMLKQLSTGSCQEILHRILFNVAHPPARIVRYIIGWNCVIALARRHRHIIIWTRGRHIFFSVIL